MKTSKSRALERTRSHKRKPALGPAHRHAQRELNKEVSLAVKRMVGRHVESDKPLNVEYVGLTPTPIAPEVHVECDNLDIIVNGILADVKALSDRLHPVLIPKATLPTTKLEEAQALSPIGARVQDTARRAGAAHASVRAILESLAV